MHCPYGSLPAVKIIDKIKLISKTVPQQGQVEKAIEHLSKHVDFTPQNENDFMLDTALAATAVDFATKACRED